MPTFVKKTCCQDLSQIAQSGHTVAERQVVGCQAVSVSIRRSMGAEREKVLPNRERKDDVK